MMALPEEKEKGIAFSIFWAIASIPHSPSRFNSC
jgi:hypothetical protein